MKYKLIVSDVDGTLVPPTMGLSSRPSQRIIDTVRRVHDTQCIFSLATARSLAGMPDLIEALQPKSMIILDNGSILYDCASGSVVWESYVQKEIAEEVLRYLSDPNLNVFLVDKGIRIEYGTDVKLPYWNISKIVVAGLTPEKANEIYRDLSSYDGIHLTKSISLIDPLTYAIHVTDAEATKGKALARVKEIMNIQTEEVLAIGDSHNDLTLFEEAGYTVAMENGEEEIKKIADFIAPAFDKDGVAVVLEKFILHPDEE